jgi:hypothetical protein
MLAKSALIRQLANVVGRRFSSSGGLNFGKPFLELSIISI